MLAGEIDSSKLSNVNLSKSLHIATASLSYLYRATSTTEESRTSSESRHVVAAWKTTTLLRRMQEHVVYRHCHTINSPDTGSKSEKTGAPIYMINN